MPAVVEGSKGRAKLFNTLDRTGAHFIALGSSSSESDEENVPLSATETETAQGKHRGRAGTLLRSPPVWMERRSSSRRSQVGPSTLDYLQQVFYMFQYCTDLLGASICVVNYRAALMLTLSPRSVCFSVQAQ